MTTSLHVKETGRRSSTQALLRSRQAALEAAARSLHAAASIDQVSCRESEIDTIKESIRHRFKTKFPGILFLSGAPGTGKTMCVNFALNSLKEEVLVDNEPRKSSKSRSRANSTLISEESTLFLNAAGLTDAFDLFDKIAAYVGVPLQEIKEYRRVAQQQGPNVAFDKLLEFRASQKKQTFSVIVIDEIDQLRGRPADGGRCNVLPSSTARRRRTWVPTDHERPTLSGDEILNLFFSFFKDPRSRCVLIAIANSVAMLHDITEDPATFESMLFEAYNVDQLRQIINKRLSHVTPSGHTDSNLIDPKALEFCIRKVASAHGDCRQVLDALGRMIAKKAYAVHQEFEKLNLSEGQSDPGEALSEEIDINSRRRPRTLGTRVTPKLDAQECTPTSRTPKQKRHRSKSTAQRSSKAVDENSANSPVRAVSNQGYSSNATASVAATEASTAASSACVSPTSRGSGGVLAGVSVDFEDPVDESVERACGAVAFADVQEVLEVATKNEGAKKRDVLKRLPQHQQLLLCSVCLVEHDQRIKSRSDMARSAETDMPSKCHPRTKHADTTDVQPISVQQILGRYNHLCHTRQILPQFTHGSVKDGLEGLQNCGFLAVSFPKEKKATRKAGLPGSFGGARRTSAPWAKKQLRGYRGNHCWNCKPHRLLR